MARGLLLLTLFTTSAFAEYRAYQYLVKTSDPFAKATKAEAQYTISTLSPQMYGRYHGGSYVSVDLLRTWMCPGYTGSRQAICDHPYDKGVTP